MIEARISRLKRRTFKEIAALPEVSGEDLVIDGKRCDLTIYVQQLGSGDLLATVQIANSSFLGLATFHNEQGLIFSASGAVREATPEELQNTGG